jgi:branched-chain amino acid transport system permease protein
MNGFWSPLRAWGISPATLAVLAALSLAPLLIPDQYILHLMVVSLLFGAQTIPFDFTTGYINIVNFGFSAFVGLGGYVSALAMTRLGMTPWLGMPLGALAAGLLGFLAGLLTLRLRGIYAAVMTWFLGLALMALATVLVDLTRGNWGLNVPLLFPGNKMASYYLLLAMTVLIWVVLRRVITSNIGLAFRAIGQDMEAAMASGINPTKYRVFNFTLACVFAGLLGGFYAHFVGVLTPDVMATHHTVEVLALSYIGGRGTLWGGMLASFIFIPLFEYLKPLMELRLIIYGVLLILVMILFPDGLVRRPRTANGVGRRLKAEPGCRAGRRPIPSQR